MAPWRTADGASQLWFGRDAHVSSAAAPLQLTDRILGYAYGAQAELLALVTHAPFRCTQETLRVCADGVANRRRGRPSILARSPGERPVAEARSPRLFWCHTPPARSSTTFTFFKARSLLQAEPTLTRMNWRALSALAFPQVPQPCAASGGGCAGAPGGRGRARGRRAAAPPGPAVGVAAARRRIRAPGLRDGGGRGRGVGAAAGRRRVPAGHAVRRRQHRRQLAGRAARVFRGAGRWSYLFYPVRHALLALHQQAPCLGVAAIGHHYCKGALSRLCLHGAAWACLPAGKALDVPRARACHTTRAAQASLAVVS